MNLSKRLYKLACGLLCSMGMVALGGVAHAATVSVGSCTNGVAYTGITFDQSGNITLTCTPVSGGAGTISLTPSSQTVNIGTTISLTPTRTVGTTGAISANYTASGTGCATTTGTINFPDGSTTPAISPITFSASNTPNSTCTVTLASGTGSPNVGGNATISVVDPSAAGVLAFTAATSTFQTGNTPAIAVARTGAGSASVAASVNFTCAVATSDGAAYSPFALTGVLNWAAGVGGNQSIPAGALPAFTGNTQGATITCTISGPTGAGVTLGAVTTQTITVIPPPSNTCQIVDQAAQYPTWQPGESSTLAPLLFAPGGAIVAYKFASNKLINASGTNLGKVTVYEATPNGDMQISNQPCYINTVNPVANNAASFLDCKRSGGGDHFTPTINYTGPNGPDYSIYAYCRLPQPDASNFYYINVRMPVGPSASYFLFYAPR